MFDGLFVDVKHQGQLPAAPYLLLLLLSVAQLFPAGEDIALHLVGPHHALKGDVGRRAGGLDINVTKIEDRGE